MSVRRLALTGAVMAALALALAGLTPDPAQLTAALRAPQQTVDTAGADALLVSAAGLAAWGVWAWGALGLALTAASALPGLAGGAARLLLGAVLPAGARRGAALALGLGLGLGVPSSALAAPAAAPGPPAAEQLSVPDWPATAAAVPDWPDTSSPHVVVEGDCLWDIAEDALRRSGAEPAGADVVTAVQAWWSANAAVVGPDPDLILPGQVLQPPTA